MRLRRIAMGALALAIPVGALSVAISPALASAATKGTGSYSCTSIKGTITFNPPLTNSGTKPDTVTVKDSVSGCSGGTPAVTTSTGSGTFKTTADSCANLAGGTPTKISEALVYPKAAGSTFKGTAQGAVGDPITFTLSGKVTGSYASASATASANIKQSAGTLATDCAGKGLKSLTIASGTITNF